MRAKQVVLKLAFKKLKTQWIIKCQMYTAIPQTLTVPDQESTRTIIIQQQLNVDSPSCSLQERMNESIYDLTGLHDVHFHQYMTLRRIDCLKHDWKELRAVDQ